jgi:hypothetical protein
LSSKAAQGEHPAKFSDPILGLLAELLEGAPRPVLDPMAGVGRLAELGLPVVLGELEPEWAYCCERPVYLGNAACMPFADNSIGTIATSPTYGNRMADLYAGDGTQRYTYRIYLGRRPHQESTCGLQWGRAYMLKNEEIVTDMHRVLRPGGQLILNVSDHFRSFKRQPVCKWWLEACEARGFQLVSSYKVKTQRMRNGENAGLRPEYELVMVFEKEE